MGWASQNEIENSGVNNAVEYAVLARTNTITRLHAVGRIHNCALVTQIKKKCIEMTPYFRLNKV